MARTGATTATAQAAPRLLSIDEFREERRAGRAPSGGVYRMNTGLAKIVDEERRAVRFCFSDGRVDLVGDTIDPNGWDFTDFQRNPVALWAHDSSSPPIGRASNLAVEGDRLMGDIEFMPVEMSAFADMIYRMVVGKYINAVSVGFMPVEYEWSNDDSRPFGLDFKEQRLLEISCCPVPANPGALAEARAKGIDTRPLIEWAEKLLDGGGRVLVPRAEIERLRKAAKDPPMARANPKKPPLRNKDDGMSEDEPSAGGAVVATCGRSADQECGMQDPEECSIHRTKEVDNDDEENKRLRRQVIALRAKLARLSARSRGAGDDPDDEPTHEDEVNKAHFHMKMSKDCYDAGADHHEEAMKCLKRALKALDEPDDDDKPEERDEPEDKPDENDEQAAAKRRVKQLLKAVS